MTQWWNNICTGEIQKKNQDELQSTVRLYNSITHQYSQHYNIHKHINSKTYIIKAQWQNKSFTGNIYDTIPKTRPNRGKHFFKCANVSNIIQIQLLFPMAQHTQYLQLIPHSITESLMRELVLLLVIFMVQSGSGYPIIAINFYYINIS